MDRQQVLDFLGSIPILQQLPGSSIKKIADVVKLRKFGPGQPIVREGEVGEGLYFIWNGEAEVPPSEHADAGHKLNPLTAGDYFGYGSWHGLGYYNQASAQLAAITTYFLCSSLRPWDLRDKVVLGPLDVRLCDPEDRVKPTNMEPRQKIWLRARGILSDDQALQRCVAAYASDWVFLETVARPHREEVGDAAKLLSLDHSVWFHNSFRADDWLLYAVESPCANNARGLVRGHMYTKSGELVVSVAQEGLIRRFDKSKVKLKSKI